VEAAASREGAHDLLELLKRLADEQVVDVDALEDHAPGGVIRDEALEGALPRVEVDRQAKLLLRVLKRRLAAPIAIDGAQLIHEALELGGKDGRAIEALASALDGGASSSPRSAARRERSGCEPSHTPRGARYHVGTMIVTETAAGTPIVERSPEEYAAYLERQVQREIGMSVAEFRRAYAVGELDDGDVAVDYLVSLLRIGQNGQSPAA
jgi:hypothetical protein